MAYNPPAARNFHGSSRDQDQTDQPKLTRRMVENIYVGDRYHEFEDYFNQFQQNNGRNHFNWCWPAFFLTIFWLFYRKMYIEGLWVLGIIVVLCIIESIFDFTFRSAGTCISVYMAVFGRWLYWRSMNRSINKARLMFRGQRRQALAWLRTQGGINIWAAVAAVIVHLAVIVVLLYIMHLLH